MHIFCEASSSLSAVLKYRWSRREGLWEGLPGITFPAKNMEVICFIFCSLHCNSYFCLPDKALPKGWFLEMHSFEDRQKIFFHLWIPWIWPRFETPMYHIWRLLWVNLLPAWRWGSEFALPWFTLSPNGNWDLRVKQIKCLKPRLDFWQQNISKIRNCMVLLGNWEEAVPKSSLCVSVDIWDKFVSNLGSTRTLIPSHWVWRSRLPMKFYSSWSNSRFLGQFPAYSSVQCPGAGEQSCLC